MLSRLTSSAQMALANADMSTGITGADVGGGAGAPPDDQKILNSTLNLSTLF